MEGPPGLAALEERGGGGGPVGVNGHRDDGPVRGSGGPAEWKAEAAAGGAGGGGDGCCGGEGGGGGERHDHGRGAGRQREGFGEGEEVAVAVAVRVMTRRISLNAGGSKKVWPAVSESEHGPR